MSLITVHSFRGGTGKSNLVANMAWLAASAGARVAVLDTDLQSPGAHVVFGTDSERIFQTLSEFVRGGCDLEEVAIDVTEDQGVIGEKGRLFLFPSSMQLDAITRILSDGYRVERLNEELSRIQESLSLDAVFLDTHPGLNLETILSASICDRLVLVVRPDDQDFQGTAVVCEVAKRIGVPKVSMVANMVVDGIDHGQLEQKIHDAFGHSVDGILPMSPDLARHGSRGIFAAKYRDHPLTQRLAEISAAITGIPIDCVGEPS